MPVVLNAANEAAVYKFLKGEIGMGDIFKAVEKEINRHNVIKNPTLDEIFAIDNEVRRRISG